MSIVKNSRTVLGPSGAHPAIQHADDVVSYVIMKHTGKHARVTGLAEEGHSFRSLHAGLEVDRRCRAIDYDADEDHIPASKRDDIHQELMLRLPESEYDIVWEAIGTARAHLHIEFQRKEVDL